MTKLKKRNIVRGVVVGLVVCIFSALCCFLMNYFGLDDITKLRTIVNNGFSGMVIYSTILALQVAFIPINSLFLIVPAIVLFGSSKAFVLSLIGLLIGSIIGYFMGKFFGHGLVKWMFGKENVDKWQKKLSSAKILLPVFLLIPIFPDELLCVAAGATRINTLYFIITIIVTRSIDLFFTCFVGAAIPFRGWFILLWVAIVLGAIYLAVLLTKYNLEIEQFIMKRIKRDKIKN